MSVAVLFARADAPRSAAYVIAALLVLGWLVYLVGNLRAGRAEVGSEIELAANRKQYFDDEVLEGSRLERMQKFGLAMLLIIALGLPLYWLAEPGRQAGAVNGYDKRFASWGRQTFAPTADGGFNCAGCHGGYGATGGVAPFTVTDPTTGQVKAINWTAPALNTVLYRFSRDEVTFILTYGRPFSPMSPWGLAGGGPMNDQQIKNLIDYLASIQLPQEGCTKANPLCKGSAGVLNKTDQAKIGEAAAALVKAGTYKTLGEALFNLDLNGGAYSCARCHTKGWSYGDPQQSGGGALGPNLTGGGTVRQFPNAADHASFITQGSELGKRYGAQGQGSGRMPGFGGLLTEEQIQAIVDYERGL
jgi:mono/diheme cytochrome c family protein